MKKLVVTLIAILLLTAAGWAGSTWFIAGQVHQHSADLAAQLSELGMMEVSVQNYRRGFLDATFDTVLELPLPPSAKTAQGNAQPATPQVFRLTFANRVHHGPLLPGAAPGLALVETRLVDMAPGQEELRKVFTQVPQLKESLAVTRVDFSGTLHERFAIPAFTTNVDATAISWGGLRSDAAYSPQDKTLKANFDMSQLDVRDTDGSLSWAGANGSFDLAEALPLVYVGASKFTFNPMEMNFTSKESAQPQSMRMQSIKAVSDSSCDGKLVAVNQTLEFEGVDINGQTYGPGTYDIEMKNLDGEVLSQLQAQARQLMRDTKDNPEQMGGQLLALYTGMMSRLLQQNPEINLRKLHFATPQGDVDANLQLRFAAVPEASPASMATMLQGLDAQAEIALHETLVRQILSGQIHNQLVAARNAGKIPDTFTDDALAQMAKDQVSNQIETFLAQNLAVRDGERLKSQATFKQGELVVNGQNLPLFQ